jgi:hypothetical protein
LVIFKKTPAKDELSTLVANAGPIAVRHSGACEFDILNQNVIALYHPDRLTLCAFPASYDPSSTADASNDEIILWPHRDVIRVLTGFYFDDIAILCQPCSGRDRRELALWTYAQRGFITRRCTGASDLCCGWARAARGCSEPKETSDYAQRAIEQWRFLSGCQLPAF